MAGSPRDDRPQEPLKSYHRILEDEIALADAELNRPAGAIAASGLLAGLGICVSVFTVGILYNLGGPELTELSRRFFVGIAYAAGFLIVIFARADLFTEYTTITLLPVILGRSTWGSLARLWAIVYAANLAGVVAGSLFLAALAVVHGAASLEAYGVLGSELTARSGAALLMGAVLVGWLMGLLSWLIVAARETVSQLLFVVVIGTVIGLGHLPHSITGTAEVLTAALGGGGPAVLPLLRFVAISTVGNAIGSVIFAVLVRYAVAEQPGDG